MGTSPTGNRSPDSVFRAAGGAMPLQTPRAMPRIRAASVSVAGSTGRMTGSWRLDGRWCGYRRRDRRTQPTMMMTMRTNRESKQPDRRRPSRGGPGAPDCGRDPGRLRALMTPLTSSTVLKHKSVGYPIRARRGGPHWGTTFACRTAALGNALAWSPHGAHRWFRATIALRHLAP